MARGDGCSRVLAAYGSGKRTGRDGDWMCTCPAHEDSSPSLHVTQGRTGAVLKCFAGCSVEDVCAAFGLDLVDLFDDRDDAARTEMPGNAIPVTCGAPGRREASEAGSAPIEAGRACSSRNSGTQGAGLPVGVTIAALAGRFGLDAEWLREVAGLRQERRTVLVPYRDESGAEIYCKRRMVLAGKDKYRFAWPGGVKGEQTPYGLDRLPAVRASKTPTLVFVEGECLPGDAEILTPSDGWVRLDEYSGQMICGWQFDGSLEMVEPSRFIKIHHSGEMVRIEARGFHALVTPNHKLPAVWAGRRGEKIFVHAACDRPKSYWNIPRCGRLDGDGIPLHDYEIALVIAICADAKVDIRKHGDAYVFFDLTKPRKIKRLRRLLRLCKIDYRDTANNNKVKAARYIKFHLPARLALAASKKLPTQWLGQASLIQRKMIIDELVHWDGNSVRNRNQTEFSARDWSEVSWAQAMAHTSGIVSTLIARKNWCGRWWKASLLHGKSMSNWNTMRVSREPWDDDVYCVTVPGGFFLVRQNGCVTVTGNSDSLCLWAHGIPALGIPGVDSTAVLRAEHVRGLRHAFVVREADVAGERFVAALADRLRMVGYEGEPLRVVEMPDGLKDAGELHAADPARFEARFRAECKAAKRFESGADLDEAFVQMSTMRRRETSWLWHPYAPAGRLTILAGLPGDGKSFICAALVAAITAGAKLPNTNGAAPQPPGSVLYFLAEDDPEETLLPRLEDNGADLTRVHAFNLAQRPFSLDAAGADFLRRAVERFHPRAVVFDPLVSVLGQRVDTIKVEQVRRALSPLVGLTQQTGTAVVAIAHSSKAAGLDVVYRVAGSHGFAAVVRSMLMTFRDPGAGRGESAGVVAHAKHNLSAQGDSLRYLIEGTRLYWRGTSPMTAQDLAHAQAAGPARGEDRGALDTAADFLREELRQGARPVAVLVASARGAGISKATLVAARSRLGVETRKADLAGGWVWRLPAGATQAAEDREEWDATARRDRRRVDREPGDDDEEIV